MNQDCFDLNGKIAVVTGGAGFLGAAFCRALADRGARVVVAELDEEKGVALAKSLGTEALWVSLDISEEKSVRQALDRVVSLCGRVDVWINNAYPRTEDWGLPFEQIPWKSWQKNVDSHLNGYSYCCQQVLESMKHNKAGSLINLASIYGVVAPDFSVYEGTKMTMPAAYAAIKGGLIQLTRYLAAYYGPHGIRVNAVSPGGVFQDQPDKFVENYSRRTPLRRMAKPEDITGAILFLASDAARYVSGHNLIVDGGWSVL